MTVSSQISSVTYDGDGVTTLFPIPYYFLKDTDLTVYTYEVSSGISAPLVLGTNYLVTGAGVQTGGALQLISGTVIAVGFELHIDRTPPVTQETEWQANDPFPAKTSERALDKLTMIAQMLVSIIGTGSNASSRALLLGLGDVNGSGAYRAQQNRISDVADPENSQDVVNLRTMQKAMADLLVDGAGDVVMGLLANTADTTLGDALVGVRAPATGAVARTQHDVNAERMSVMDFGARGNGTVDDTEAFIRAQSWAGSVKGARIEIPPGTYVLTDFVIDTQNVSFEGTAPGYGYASTDLSVKLVPGPSATFVARLKGTATGVTISASAYSGFKNVQFQFAEGTCQYGLFIDSDNTVCENVSFQGFPYGCVMADQVNSNKFRNCSFVLNTHVGFAVTEWQAAPYLYPGITVTSVTNTKFSMEGCNFRQNNFGIVIRSALGGVFDGCVIESNDQAGLYIYRPDNSTVRQLTFRNCWFENNYQEYTTGSTEFSVTGNRMFLIGGDSTYIAWTSANQAGYQIVIDSQTHYGGGADTFLFDFCQIAGDTAAQKGVRILSGFKFDFNRAWLVGGDIDNFIYIDYTAQAVHWIDPLAANNPYGLVPSLTNAFGASTGSNSVYLRSGTTFRPGELGAIYPQLGAYGGPIHFLGQVDGDPRNGDARMLDDYFETLFPGQWRTDGANPFNVVSETSYFTKIGRLVKIQCRAVLQVNASTASQQTLYLAGGLPQGAENSGMLVGRILVLAGSGATAVVNNGRTEVITNTTSTISGVDPVFPALTPGHQYTITLDASYITKT
ncbi:right-handed parallel beta-helix repeat-containing protein [Pandoraea sp. NPDC090278]|uniref:right-handed parallel beta-helix repeat-containing protein n=1 Tax=Pandoraea sp. NPDC090278 TaxID=3364391 RepID=UPI00383A5B74